MGQIPAPDDEGGWVALDVDRETPNPARMYDYYLGGGHNFGVDRALAHRALEAMPWMREAVRANRRFLRRGVQYCVAEGLDQYLDLGAGIPTVGATHETVRAGAPDAEVVYVDNEPVAVSHGRLMLESVPRARIVDADLRDPAALLARPEVAEVLDFSRPMAVLLLAVLHFVADDDEVTAILEGYRAALAPGSLVLFSHVTADHDPEESARAEAVYRRSENAVTPRSRERLAGLLSGFDLVAPGLVDATEWRADPAAARGQHAGFYAAVGVVPPR